MHYSANSTPSSDSDWTPPPTRRAPRLSSSTPGRVSSRGRVRVVCAPDGRHHRCGSTRPMAQEKRCAGGRARNRSASSAANTASCVFLESRIGWLSVRPRRVDTMGQLSQRSSRTPLTPHGSHGYSPQHGRFESWRAACSSRARPRAETRAAPLSRSGVPESAPMASRCSLCIHSQICDRILPWPASKAPASNQLCSRTILILST